MEVMLDALKFYAFMGALVYAGAVLVVLSLSVYRRDGRW